MNETGRTRPGKAPEPPGPREAPRRARFRIFLGMAAGVGKTFAMLKDAQAARARGADIVVGWVEAHGRKETDALLEGLERIAPKSESYRGIEVRELDLDAALARRPAVLLVDELAHTNTPGMRHAKRYDDVLELLDAGIEVWTTVNIQHLESMADSVELLTLAPVRERVPDSVFDRADEVQLIDLPPDELLRRLAEGKVYTGDASREAVSNFFTKTNLSALREIALRQASLLASHDTTASARGEHPTATGGGGILVAVSASPHGQDLLRWARRLAYSLRAELECLHVDSGDAGDEGDSTRLAATLALAKDLGASVTTVAGDDIPAAIARHARDRDSFVIVVGKSGLAAGGGLFRRRTLSERIIVESGSIPVFAVQERPLREPLGRRAAKTIESSPPLHYAAAFGAVAVATTANIIILPTFGYRAASIIYLMTISLLALALERRAVFAAAFVSALIWDFAFIPPRFTFTISRPEDVLMLGLYFVVAVTTGLLTARLRSNERLLRVREARLGLMSDLAAMLAGTSGMEAILEASGKSLARAFRAEIIFFLQDDEGELVQAGGVPREALGEHEIAAARWAFEKGGSAGRFTHTLPSAAWHFVPLEAPKSRVGVLGIKPDEGGGWTADSRSWLATMARTVSMAVERERLDEKTARALFLAESERLGAALLDSVSHEMRTPLAVIQGAASALAADPEEAAALGEVARRELVSGIAESADRLDAIVEDLLSMGRLESGNLAPRLGDRDPVDIASTAVEMAMKEATTMTIELLAPTDPLPVRCDESLVVQVLVNLLRNCARHAGPAPRVKVSVEQTERATLFGVRDDGPGVPRAELPLLFAKFHRAPGAAGGLGLGLSICKGFVECQGGQIEARNFHGRGFEVRFSLPMDRPSATLP